MIGINYEMDKIRQKIVMAFVWMLPRWLVYWCGIRMMASATTGQYSSTVVPELTGMEALQRWSNG